MQLKKLTTLAAIGVTATATAVVAASPAAAATNIPGTYNTIVPTRILDTRTGAGAPKAAVGARKTLTFRATTPIGGSPASAVQLTLTVLSPTTGGYLTVFRGGTARPTTSNINFEANHDVPGAVVSQVDSGGKISIFNGSDRPVQLIAALNGYWTGGAVGTTAGAFVPVAPTRLLDTRAAGSKALQPGVATPLQVSGRAGVPANATGVLVNVAGTASKSGDVTVSATAQDAPAPTSTVTFPAGAIRANLTSVPLGGDGTVSLVGGASVPTTAIVDVVGYFTAGSDNTPAADGSFVTSDPYRVADTRTAGALAKGATRKIPILSAGQNTAFKAVALNVIALPTSAGYVTTWNGAGTRPTANLVNVTTGLTQTNLVIVPINDDGTISIFNGTQSNLNAVVDVAGFVLNDLSMLSRSAAEKRVARVLVAAQSRALR